MQLITLLTSTNILKAGNVHMKFVEEFFIHLECRKVIQADKPNMYATDYAWYL